MAGERKFIKENVRRVLLKEYLKEQVKRAGFGGVDIQRTPMGTRVLLITERPGLVIGRKGSSIKALTHAIEFDFGFDKPQVEVAEVENPNLSAQIMAEKLASALERGWHFRRAGHSTVRRIMENGAKGCQVIISGKLTGQRHRTEKFKEGHIKFCGEPKLQWMEEGYTPAKLKQGVIGVKVQIMHPDARLPDEVNIMDPEKVKALDEEKSSVKEEAVEEPAQEPEKKAKPKKEEPGKPEPKEREVKTVEPEKAEEPAEKPPEARKEVPASEPKKPEEPKADEKAPEPKKEEKPEVKKPEPTDEKAPSKKEAVPTSQKEPKEVAPASQKDSKEAAPASQKEPKEVAPASQKDSKEAAPPLQKETKEGGKDGTAKGE